MGGRSIGGSGAAVFHFFFKTGNTPRLLDDETKALFVYVLGFSKDWGKKRKDYFWGDGGVEM